MFRNSAGIRSAILTLTILAGFGQFARTDAPAASPWDVAELQAAPKFEVVAEAKNGLQEILFAGPAYKRDDTRTKVFAYYGRAKAADGKPLTGQRPALVLVHGWAGHAMDGWVQEANRRGFHALALSTNGIMGRGDALVPDEFRGPGDGYTGKAKGDSPFAPPAGEPPHHRWMYHAVADILLANSLLRSFPEVDAERIGLWGVSWGGYHTCIAAGIDERFRAAVPQYGCGFLHENGAWSRDIARMKPDERDAWVKLWDPSQYVGQAKMPVLFFNGHNDSFYPLDAWTKTRRLVKSAGTRSCVAYGLGHGHFWDERAASVWRFLGEHLQDGEKLPTISPPEIQDGGVVAHAGDGAALVSATLYYTRGPASQNNKRAWESRALTLSTEGQISGEAPPKGATAWFVGVSDTAETKHYQVLATSDAVIRQE